jgi:hypothetical protein
MPLSDATWSGGQVPEAIAGLKDDGARRRLGSRGQSTQPVGDECVEVPGLQPNKAPNAHHGKLARGDQPAHGLRGAPQLPSRLVDRYQSTFQAILDAVASAQRIARWCLKRI